MVTALVKVALIGTSRGRTFLDDDREFDDIAGFVPDLSAAPVQLTVSAGTADSPSVEPPAADSGHSVAA
jgi:hypothetical protein